MTRGPLIAIGTGLVAMVVLDLLLGRPIPGFWALFGVVSCVLLILASKWIGKRFVLRDAGYYEPSTDTEPADVEGGG